MRAHACSLEESDGYNAQIALDVFREDPDYQANEAKYEVRCRACLFALDCMRLLVEVCRMRTLPPDVLSPIQSCSPCSSHIGKQAARLQAHIGK